MVPRKPFPHMAGLSGEKFPRSKIDRSGSSHSSWPGLTKDEPRPRDVLLRDHWGLHAFRMMEPNYNGAATINNNKQNRTFMRAHSVA